MDAEQVSRARIAHLGLAAGSSQDPVAVVRALGAVQAQDYGPALWSLGDRTGLPLAAVEAPVLAGTLIRTHVLRPTWHLVPAEDLRWMLSLTAPRVQAFNAPYYRANRLDAAALEHARLTVRDLVGQAGQLTRPRLRAGLVAAGIDLADIRLALILMHAELTATICSGVPEGKQQSYALFEDRIPVDRELTRDQALAELAVRYFTSHGPASVPDLRWWASLTRPDILRGIELAGDRLRQDELAGIPLWGPADPAPSPPDGAPRGHLLQAYDEYVVGYSRTKYVLDLAGLAARRPPEVTLRNHVMLLDGQLCGHWRRTLRRGTVLIEVTPERPLGIAELAALEAEAVRHGEFLGLDATLSTLDTALRTAP